MNVSPKAFSHIGLSVPDLDAAVAFYTEVLGLYTIMEPTEVFEDGCGPGNRGVVAADEQGEATVTGSVDSAGERRVGHGDPVGGGVGQA